MISYDGGRSSDFDFSFRSSLLIYNPLIAERVKLHLFVAVDRTSKFAFARLMAEGDHRHRQDLP
ncbi:hypothetical protein BFX40_02445 [Mesorhizobium sp. SEMIA 3007]|nr:hypothetical protein BFX40_02445 [Mesorhizobium sp. SEMIA 3007]